MAAFSFSVQRFGRASCINHPVAMENVVVVVGCSVMRVGGRMEAAKQKLIAPRGGGTHKSFKIKLDICMYMFVWKAMFP